MMMEGGANEVRYKIAEFLLKRMHEDKLLTEEEWDSGFLYAARIKLR